MSLNDTASGQRVHIGFFGMRNAGKSSLVNAITGQQLSVVSPVAGTTTDPVRKAMELLPVGPVMIVDTPGIDDDGQLGLLRVEKTRQTLSRIHVAVLVADAAAGLRQADKELLALFEEKHIPHIIAWNKSDIALPAAKEGIAVSALTGKNIERLKEMLAELAKGQENNRVLAADLVSPGDVVVLVIPIDEAAPKGRIILPQQMVLRELLDNGCIPVACRDTELEKTLSALAAPPRLVITDSQVFGKVAAVLPNSMRLTSFSILLARYKGSLPQLIKGAEKLDSLKDGDKVLICEGCTHHRQCNDIGTVKLPNWLREYTDAELRFEFTSGGDYPAELSGYDLILHCGGCMLNDAEMKSRVSAAVKAGVPMINYGMAIAKMNGILERSLAPLNEKAIR